MNPEGSRRSAAGSRVRTVALFCLLLSAYCLLSSAERVTVTILATTDLHGHIYPHDYLTNQAANRGLAKVATLIAEARKRDPEALLIDCGDTIEGAIPQYLHQQRVLADGDAAPRDPMMAAMNYLGFDAMVVGNHEFNYGPAVLAKSRREADFPWITANITPAADEEEALAIKKRQYGVAAQHMASRTFEPLLLKEVRGVQIAVIGLTTPAIPNWEQPEHIRGYRFEPPPQAARYWIKHLRDIRDADVVIVAAHTGLERDPQTGEPQPQDSAGENTVYQLAVGTAGIDAIVFGHSHRELPQALLNDVLLVQPKSWGQSLAEITLVLEREGAGKRWKIVEKTSRTVPVTEATPADPKVLDLARPAHEAALAYLNAPVAEARNALDAERSRIEDNAAIDAIHEVQLATAQADVSLTSVFNPSARIPGGHFTARHIAMLYPYYNTLFAVETSGRALKEALEHSARFFARHPLAPGAPPFDPIVLGFNYDTAAGVTYKIDVTRPAGDRIVDLRFRGAPLEPDRKLRLAINSYRKSGGGGYGMFRNAPVLWKSDADVRELMIRYYREKKVISWTADGNWKILPETIKF